MSMFDNRGTLTNEDIKELISHNDIKCNFYTYPLEADIMLGNIIAINFTEKDIMAIKNSNDSFDKAFIAQIVEKINYFSTAVKEEVISDIKLLNTTTEKYIYQFREEAYLLYANLSENPVSKEDFLKTDYHDKNLLISLIGQEKSDFLLKRDPLINGSKNLSFINKDNFLMIDKEGIKSIVRDILSIYNSSNYINSAGLILTEITKENPETVFDDYKRTRDIDPIFDCVESLSTAEVKEINDMLNDFRTELIANKDNLAIKAKAKKINTELVMS